MSGPNIITTIFNTYKNFSECSGEQVSQGLCPWIEEPYEREDICLHLTQGRFPKFCSDSKGLELFEVMLICILSLLLFLMCLKDGKPFHDKGGNPAMSLFVDDLRFRQEEAGDDWEVCPAFWYISNPGNNYEDENGELYSSKTKFFTRESYPSEEWLRELSIDDDYQRKKRKRE